jgi:nucleoside-diphosphate-sugar epimerase
MEVVVLDKLLFGGEGLLPLLDHPRFRLVAGDIREERTLGEAMKGAEAIVHLAAIVGEEACQVDPENTVSVNEGGTREVIRMAGEQGVRRFIFLSTCSNYGISSSEQLADEDTPLRPLSLYAETKVRGEQTALSVRAGNMTACVLRLGTICGASGRMRFNLLLNEMARAAARGEKITVYAPHAWRPFLHIRDAARAIEHGLEVPGESIRGEVFNVVGENLQKKHMIELVLKHFPGTPVEIKESGGRERDPRDYRVSGERIARKIQFRPERRIEQAFLEVAAAVRQGVFADAKRALYEALPRAPDEKGAKAKT